MTTQAGLFQLDMIDHHAVLGCPLTIDPKKIRKRYLKIARKLHPDSLRTASDEERAIASELLSKQVNPAYETLTQDKQLKEYKVLLKMKQKQLKDSPELISYKSEQAQFLLKSASVSADYESAINKLASGQFDNLSQVAETINKLSELNAAFLSRQNLPAQGSPKPAAQETSAASPPAHAASTSPKKPADPSPSAPRRSSQDQIIDSYLKRAEELEIQRDYSRGILELREAIASHPKNARCHAYLAHLYLKSGQATLARIHAKQALTFEPGNETAQKVQTQLAKASKKAAGGKKGKANAAKSAAKGKVGQSKGGGLFGGLFGSKKS